MVRFFKFLFLATCAAFAIACSQTAQYNAIPHNATILVLGDSLSYGTGASPAESYPTLLAANTGWQIINAGVPGDTTAQGLARLPDLMDEHQPQYLFIELGGNDFLQNVDANTTEQNLRAIIELAKANGVPAILIAIPNFEPVKAAFGSLSDHPMYQTIAEETQTPLVANIFSDVLDDNALKSDYVHPNAKGYQIVESNLREALQAMGLLE